MEKGKHTPGPWRVTYPGGFNYKVIPHYGPCVCVVDGTYADLMTSEEHEVEHIANAKLIAAAPELLEALIALEKANPNSANWDYTSATDAARKAIKKATEIVL
jgi:hypothetical protein